MYRNIHLINTTGETFIVCALEREGDPEGLKNISSSLAPGSPHRAMNKAAGVFLRDAPATDVLILQEAR